MCSRVIRPWAPQGRINTTCRGEGVGGGASRAGDRSENVRVECIEIFVESGKIRSLRNMGVRGKTAQRIGIYWLPSDFCSFLKKIFIFKIFVEIELIYNVVLDSGIQQSDSVIHIYVYIYILFIFLNLILLKKNFFGCATWLVGFYFPNQGSNPGPQQ